MRRTATGVLLVLAAQLALVDQGSGLSFAAGSTGKAAKAPKSAAAGPAQAQDEASAMLTARLRHRRIEVLSDRTADSSTYALPNGQLQTEAYAGPVRTKTDGGWKDIDTSLSDTGADLTPAAAAADIAVSDGGDTGLASVRKGRQSFGLGWSSRLPAPQVRRNTASYALGGGQTLSVTALAQGFSEDIALAHKPAGGSVSYRIPLRLDGLTLSRAASGHLLLKDTGGKLVAEAPAPMMWDASRDPRSGESAHQEQVTTSVETAADGSQTLVLTPDPTFLATASYPVTVDPTTTLAVTTDTWVQNPDYTDSQISSEELKSGTYDGGTDTARSYLKFDVSKFAGKHVTAATMSLYNYYSATCSTAGAATQARRITSTWSSSSVTWGAQPSTTTTGMATNTGHWGYDSSCAANWSNWNLQSIVQAWADGSTNYGLQIRSADEADSTTWRRFRSANYSTSGYAPKLVVTYNSYAVASAPAVSPSQVNAYNGKRYVTSLTPTLSAKATDADGGNAQAQFEITPDPSYADTTYTYTAYGKTVASGSTSTLTIPSASAFPAGSHLRFRVRAYDGTDFGAWSGYTTFVLNTAKPNAPTVSCATYPQNGWTAKAASAVSCTLDTDSTDGAGYSWGLDDSALPNKKLDTTDGTGGDAQTVSIDPAGGWHTLYARTIDSGGNLSTATTAYSFGVGADGAAILSPQDGDTTARRLTLSARGLTSYTGVTWQYRRGETDSWHTVPVGDVTASGSAVSAWPVAVTGGTAAKLVWNTVNTLSEDGVIQLRAAFTDGSTTGNSQTVDVTLDRDAGTAPTAPAGPGQVNELTGDYTLSATDASAFAADVERTYSSRANSTDTEGEAKIFGPGWVSSVSGETVDSTQVRKTSATSVEVVSADGSTIAFTATGAGGWQPQTGSEELTLTGSLTGTTFTLTDTDADTTVFKKAATGATTWTLSSYASAVDDSTVTTVSETVASGGQTLARPRYVISPTGAVTAATCQATPSTKGCRVLEFVYATSTTATGSVTGDYTGQVKAIKLWATTPGASSATAETVESYAYDASGELREAWDPRTSPALKTQYTYDTAGRVTTLTEPGELPWTFTYGQAGSALTAGAGMLLSASRPQLAAGSTGTTSGTATTTVVYDVPLSGSTAPYQMDAATVATWAQDVPPTDATAVFPADSVPSSSTGGDLTSSSYARATVTYIDADGERTDTANPGGGITTAQYDEFGNTVSELTAANRALALSGADDRLTALGLADLPTADRARLLSTVSAYSADGSRVTDTYSPLYQNTLTQQVTGSTADTTLAAGTVVPARVHTAYAYDENRPSDAAVSGLVTSTVTGAAIPGYATDADTRTVTTSYDWATGQEKATTGGQSTDTVTTYDGDGQVATTRTAGSSGSDADTLTYTYYSAGATGACASAEWDGLLCRTAPAAAITNGGSNPSQAVTTVYTYDRWGRIATKAETANGVTRTTTNTVDGAGRTTKVEVTGGTGTATPALTLTYDQDNGRIATQTSNGQTVAYTYDDLGRQHTYDDGAGNVSTTSYDGLDRPVKTTDSVPSTVSYAYDTAGDVKTLTDSVAGAFTASYDADGTLTSETLPGSYTLNVTTDTVGRPTGRAYTASDGTTVASDTAGYTDTGLQSGHTQTAGATVQSDYAYDSAGRLTRAADTAESGCTTRAYTFDASSNRTGLTTTTDDCDSSTSDSTSTSVTNTYDSADRLVSGGRAYDAFGRTTTAGGTTLSYYTDDLVRSETVGAGRSTWSLDGAGRLAVRTSETQAADGTWSTGTTTVNHYGCGCDSPTWSTGGGTVSRDVTDLSGALTATTTATGGAVLQLTDLHGDVTVQQPLDTSQASTALRYDEFGNALDATGSTAYGWLGGRQRAEAPLSGLTLMGVRLYDPTAGRFLSVDPVLGGSANAYDYAGQDPVNAYDLAGTFRIYRWKWGQWHYVQVYLSSTFQRDLAQGAIWGLAGGLASFCAGFGCYLIIGFIAGMISNHVSDSWHPRAKWLLFAWKWPGSHHWWTVYRIRATFVGWWYA